VKREIGKISLAAFTIQAETGELAASGQGPGCSLQVIEYTVLIKCPLTIIHGSRELRHFMPESSMRSPFGKY